MCEVGPVADIYAPPYHPYTETLLAAVPEPVPGAPARQGRAGGGTAGTRLLFPATLSPPSRVYLRRRDAPRPVCG
ncbi:ABC transporter ATP-binding protein [Candidatus Entotheonella palauensis]|uniref:ABC transporter ATP-binding protein n=1 Tax=Candidatus Entotheonella palauensis TaxID=93172 RepID=UPI0030B99B69